MALLVIYGRCLTLDRLIHLRIFIGLHNLGSFLNKAMSYKDVSSLKKLRKQFNVVAVFLY